MEQKIFIKKMNSLAAKGLPFWFVVSFDGSEGSVFSPVEAVEMGILFDFNGTCNFEPQKNSFSNLLFQKQPVAFERYKEAFELVQKHLLQGDSYLVNLTFPSKIEINCSLAELFFAVEAKYKLLFRDEFVVFSPEPFVKIENGVISTFPMKGTIDANLPDAEETLLSNQKELAEHATIVDLLRNDLSRVATEVAVKRFRYVETICSNEKTLLQVSSEISGKLPVCYRNELGDLLLSMLPAGSISGAPKKKTLEIIAEAERYKRGFYTGISGYFDGNNLDSCVLIRFIESMGDGFVYKSGGGITAQSNLEEEYQELIDKIYVPIGRIDQNRKRAATAAGISQPEV